MPDKLTYIDLFAGCGGLSLGLHQAGWKGLFAIEKSPYAFKTLQHNLIKNVNHFDWPNWLEEKEHDVNLILKEKKEELRLLRGSVDMIVGGPPCQGFSTAGKRIENDNRNQLINSYVNFIRLVQPKLIFFENVKGFTQRFEKNKSKGIKYSEFVQKSLRRKSKNFEGYEVFGKLINFAEFGIPQKRTRFILIGLRKDLVNKSNLDPKDFFDLIERNKFSFLESKNISVTQNIKDAISDLLESNGKEVCPDSKGFTTSLYSNSKSNYQFLLRKNIINPLGVII